MKLVSARDPIIGLSEGPDCTVEDFWRWSFSNLCDDGLKGQFAEWMVGKLLGLDMKPGGFVSGDNVDLILPNGTKIEVKSSSYWQSWKLENRMGRPLNNYDYERTGFPKDEQIIFPNLISSVSDGSKNSTTARKLKADIYVFCFQTEKSWQKWDALDLGQWEFYVLTADELETIRSSGVSSKAGAAKTFRLSLATLRRRSPRTVANDLRTCVDRALDAIGPKSISAIADV